MFWENCSRATDTGFMSELPTGIYYIGNPEELLLPGVYASIKNLNTGTFEDAESDAIIVIHPFNVTYFNLVSSQDTVDVFSENGVIALMSEDIVKPLPEFARQKVILSGRTVVEIDIQEETLAMTRGEELIALVPADEEPEESDEQMYVRLYAAQGIQY